MLVIDPGESMTLDVVDPAIRIRPTGRCELGGGGGRSQLTEGQDDVVIGGVQNAFASKLLSL